MKLRSVLFVFAFGLFTAACGAAPAEQWIVKARAFLGREDDLDAVTSVRFTGHLETTERVPSPDDAKAMVDRPLNLPIEIVFQKNDRQLITVRSEKVVETTALDGYDAWQRRSDPANSTKWQLTLLDSQQIKRLRANTWENLHFFKGLEKRGGRVEYQGEADIDGHACVKIAFTHAENIVFVRFFDKTTGQLLQTVTESGGLIREEGQMMASGVRFPKKVVNKTPAGQITTITFDTVTVNQPLPAADFAVPELKMR